MFYKKASLYNLLISILLCNNVAAQTPPDTLIQLKGAIKLAEQRYHLLKSKKYEADAASKYIDVVRYSRLPTIDATYQAGLGTANNLTGIFFPVGILPMTGPPSTSNNFNPAIGSAASVLLNWQAETFGQRNALINVSIAEANSKNLEWQQALFQQKINVISSYLDLVLAYEVVLIHHQNIDRVQANLKQSRVLANSGIKPGVDTALFLSELSRAKIDSINAQTQLQKSKLVLAQMIVSDALPVPSDTSFLSNLPTFIISNDTAFTGNPIIQYVQSQVDLSHSKESLLKKSYLPKLNVWATGFARGSGFQANGLIKTFDGINLNRYNYGSGVQLIFPILKYGEVKKQLLQQNYLSKAAQEQVEENIATLSTQQSVANVTFNNSIAIAAETRQQLKSGLYAFNAMQVRYNTGLVNFSDLIEAQYTLLKAELDFKRYYWDAWKALLLQASIRGDENIFLNEIK